MGSISEKIGCGSWLRWCNAVGGSGGCGLAFGSARSLNQKLLTAPSRLNPPRKTFMKKLFLHIGTEKTGTSSLQGFLKLNERQLAKRGYWIPRCLVRPNHSLLAICCYDEFRHDDLCRYYDIHEENKWLATREKIRSELLSEIASCNSDNIIISSEHFQSRLYSASEKLRLKLLLYEVGCSEVKIILYLRDPASLANSHYFSDVAQGSVSRHPDLPNSHYFNNLCDHRQTILDWSKVFGKDCLEVRLYDPYGTNSFSIVDDFLTIFPQLDHSSFKKERSSNVSMSALGIEIIRQINEIEPFWIDGLVNPRRKKLNHIIRKNYKGKKYGMPEWLVNAYDAAFADSNEWVRQQYFPKRDQLFVRKGIKESQVEISVSEKEVQRVLRTLHQYHSLKLKKIIFVNYWRNILSWVKVKASKIRQNPSARIRQ